MSDNLYEFHGEAPAVGDVWDGPNGLTIVTPFGDWHVTIPAALKLAAGLAMMTEHKLTRPWSAEDLSTILSRGARHLTAEERREL